MRLFLDMIRMKYLVTYFYILFYLGCDITCKRALIFMQMLIIKAKISMCIRTVLTVWYYTTISYFSVRQSIKVWYRCFISQHIPAGTWRKYNVASTSMQRHDVASTLRRRCIYVMCHDVASTLRRRCIYVMCHDVASTLRRRYIYVMCPLGYCKGTVFFWSLWSINTGNFFINKHMKL